MTKTTIYEQSINQDKIYCMNKYMHGILLLNKDFIVIYQEKKKLCMVICNMIYMYIYIKC